MRRSRLLLIVTLFIGTVTIYLAALHQSIEAYELWKETQLEEVYDRSLSIYIDFKPYYATREGEQMLIIGALLVLGWLSIRIIFSENKNEA